MAYIIKNTAGLINTRITDIGRQKMSQGNFNISYFQVGDSEISYSSVPSYNQSYSYVLEPAFNSQNGSPAPQSNKQNVKYPFYVNTISGGTYGIPFMASEIQPVFNAAPMRGFFSGDTTQTNISWSARTGSEYVISSDYVIDLSLLDGLTNEVTLIYSGCNPYNAYTPSAGDFVTIYFDGEGNCDCNCVNLPTPTPTPTIGASPTPTPTPSSTPGICVSPTPSRSLSSTPSVSEPYNPCPPVPPVDGGCSIYFSSCTPILTYRVVSVCNNIITLDRPLPNYIDLGITGNTRVLIYPPDMTTLYDSIIPQPHWNQDVFNYQAACDVDLFDVNIWNMNVPWTENPAGLLPNISMDYTNFGSVDYIGSKEYFRYNNSTGQTDSDSVYYYNSLGDKITVTPEEQKSIAIIHYTNNTIDFVYGEKFALQSYDNQNTTNTVGMARNFKVHLPWLQWHKSNNGCCYGQTFYVDPAGFDELNLFDVHYLTSNENLDMNTPGHRYYHLWDTNPFTADTTSPSYGFPNRIGKVFPDLHTIIIDDDEIIAAMSYKSNRNWTLPAPRVGLTIPSGSNVGVMTGNTEYMYVTYRFTNTTAFTNSLHCNYYQVIQGPSESCGISDQNVSVRFGEEFSCLSGGVMTYDKFEIICQKVTGNGRPDSSSWKIIDFSDQISATTIPNTTFIIDDTNFNVASTYNLNNYISLTSVGQTGQTLNFGDEFYFYGNIETEIQATIYEMKYLCNLSQNEFKNSSNPTFNTTYKPYITEIGLYDSDKDLIVISKLQSPVLRTGVQQFLVKLDF